MIRHRPLVDVETLEGRRMLAAQAPYSGTPFLIGSNAVTIQAEHFDLGGQDVAYADNSPGNGGGTTFRSGEDVDLKGINGGGYRVLGTYVGEWIEYTIDVDAAGTYTLDSRVSSKGSGGTFHVELRDVNSGAFVSNLTGTLTIPNTGGHEDWVTLTKDVTLPAGTHVLRVAIDSNSTYGSAGNFDAFTLTSTAAPTPTPTPSGTITLTTDTAAHVRGGDYASRNYGSATHLDAKLSTNPSSTRESYIKFDLAGVPSVADAKLRVYGRLSDTQNSSVTIGVHHATNTSWSESSITWNNKPTSGASAHGTFTVTGTSDTWHEIDLTDFLAAELAAGRTLVTLVLKGPVASKSAVLLASDESASNAPQLVITSQDELPPPPPQDIVLNKTSLAVNEGSQGDFTVRLATAPTSDVAVTVSKNAGGDEDLAADKATLTFTPANWDTAQTVTVRAAEDADSTNGQATFTIASSGLTSKTVLATESDNDAASTPTTIATTTAAHVRGGDYASRNFGSATSLEAKLSTNPSATRESYLKFDLAGVASVADAKLRVHGRLTDTQNSSVALAVHNASNTSWSESSITWNNKPASGASAHATFTVTGTTAQWYEVDLSSFLAAELAAGRTLVTLVLKGPVATKSAVLLASDESASNAPQLVITPQGPPPQNLIVSTGSLTVNEGSQAAFTVKLAAQPTADVTVTVSKNTGGDVDLTADKATLAFTAANWDVAQTVNIAAAEDGDTTNGQATFTIASSGLTSKSVVATENDNDTPTPQGLVVSHTALTVPEASKSLFTVKLAAAPTANVTVTIAKNGSGDPDLSSDKTSLVFTPTNWDVPQQVAISAAADPDTTDGSATFTIASSGLSSKSVVATEDDDDTTRQPGTYYVNLNGNDANAGTSHEAAWQTIAKVNAMTFIPGDTILFRGEQSFNGSIFFNASDTGTSSSGALIAPITVGSYGVGSATISSGSSAGFFAQNNGGITVQNLNFVGAGLGTNTSDGIAFFNNASGNITQNGINVNNVSVRGYGQNGLGLGGFNGASGYRNVQITNSQFFENRDGITVYGPAFNDASPVYVNQNLRVANVLAYNNHGTSGVTNPTGNGIVFGSVAGGVIERSVAHHNGASNSSKTGPVGIWAYNADRITIQHNESYSNRRGTGGDGDGFDFDQNVSNSLMQYNYAHDNDGAGYLIYTGKANNLHDDNVVRYNISERDGRTTGYGGVVIGGRVTDLDIYNNTIYFPSGTFGTGSAAVYITSIGDRVHLRNNIIFTTGGARMISTPDVVNQLRFQRNVYWPGGGSTAIRWGATTYSSVSSWLSARTEQERVDLDNNGSLDLAALTSDPRLTSAGNGGTIGDANNLSSLSAYKLLSDSPMRDVGLDLLTRYGINPGTRDFWGTTLKQGSGFDLGADEF